ncbi:MAG TPA: DMT family transporter [Hyphomicrobiaceae bacterium]|jgi:drug/metabolite transporter (DMT)-like permease|nr:DMT family transporter [Hyphomicrobiaceae bacterium]
MTLAVPASARSENVRGIISMLAAMAVFVLNDTLMKLAASHVPTGQAIFLRGVFTVGLCLVLVVASNLTWALPHTISPRVLVRSVLDIGSTVLFMLALMHMPLADIFGILQFTPLAITAGAALFLGARVGWRRWLAATIGLLGVLLIVRPGGTAFNPYAILVLGSILCSVSRDLITRGVAQHVPSLLIAASSATLVMLSSLGFTLFETWHWPSLSPTLMLAASAVALLAGQYWLIAAMRIGEIAVVAPFRYSLIVWAVAAGYIVWGEMPDLASWLGIAIVSLAGLYTFLREQHLARLAKPT